MRVITIESEAYKRVMEKLETIFQVVSSFQKLEAERQQEQKENEKPYTSSEVSKILRISTKTLQRLRARNEISFTYIGGKVAFRSSDIKEYLNRKSTDNKSFSISRS